MAPSDLRGFEGSNLKITMLQVLQGMTEGKEIPCVPQPLGSAPALALHPPASPYFSVPACAKTPQM